MHGTDSARTGWTFAITAGALFMFALDRLIVATALPAIQRELGASVQALEWMVNAYTLTFLVLLLPGAALGDRFGRRRVFVLGLAAFTAGSVAAALAPSPGALIAARAIQGAGGSVLLPLSLTLLSAATPAERRGAVLGAWAAVAGVAAALGPVLGGVLTDTLSWHWIFWLNVPIGIALIPLARRRLTEGHGPHTRLDLFGIALSATGLLALVWALVDAGQSGWSSPRVMLAGVAGAIGIAAFVAWELRAPAPMVPMRCFRAPGFAGAIAVSLLGYFGLFGALFLIGQLLQTGIGASPLHAGLGLLPMTGAMAATAPGAGALCDRIGPRPLLAGALALMTCALAWIAVVAAPGVTFPLLAPGLVLVGMGAACLFAPLQVTLLSAVRPQEQSQASGTATVVRELGGVLGVAVLAGIFTSHGDTATPAAFLDGFRPALAAAAVAAAAATAVALALPGRPRPTPQHALEPAR
jgi:EmrB/QacA subfamily drug resistance transporter